MKKVYLSCLNIFLWDYLANFQHSDKSFLLFSSTLIFMWCKRSERWWHVQTSSEVLFTSFDHFFLLFFFCFSVLFFAYLQKLSKKVQKMTKKKEGSKRRRRDRRQKQTIAFCLLFRWFLSVEPQPRCEILKICEKIQNAWEDNSKQSPLLLLSSHIQIS